MSKEEEMAVIGRMVMEQADLRRHLSAIEDECSQIAKEFDRLSELLKKVPDAIAIDGQGQYGVRGDILSADRIRSLVSDAAKTRNRLVELKQRLNAAGIISITGI